MIFRRTRESVKTGCLSRRARWLSMKDSRHCSRYMSSSPSSLESHTKTHESGILFSASRNFFRRFVADVHHNPFSGVCDAGLRSLVSWFRPVEWRRNWQPCSWLRFQLEEGEHFCSFCVQRKRSNRNCLERVSACCCEWWWW